MVLAGRQVVAEYGRRSGVTGIRVESFDVIRAPREAAGRAQAGQFDRTERLAFEVEPAHFAVRIFHVLCHQAVVDDQRRLQGFGALRHDFLPVRFVRIFAVHGNDARTRSAVVREEIKRVRGIAQKLVFRVPIAQSGGDGGQAFFLAQSRGTELACGRRQSGWR